MLDKITKYVLYLTIFLTPLFFLPWTAYPTAYNKQAFLSAAVLLLLVLWAAKCVVEKKIILPWGKLPLAVLVFLAVLGLSAIFSLSRYQSFWGPGAEADSFWNFLLFALIFFFAANFSPSPQPSHLAGESKGEGVFTFKALGALLASSGLLSLIFLLQNFLKILPWDFTKAAGWSPVDSPYALALFSVGALGLGILVWPLMVANLRRRLAAIALLLVLILNFVVILLVNYWLAWLGLVFFALIMLWMKILFSKEGIGGFEPQTIILPILLLVISLVFLIVKPSLPSLMQMPLELTPSYKSTLSIGKQTIKEGVKEFVLGAGPAAFGYQFNLYKPSELNLTQFWQMRFAQGRSAFGTLLTTSGILGVLAGLLLLSALILSGVAKLRRSLATPDYTLFASVLYFFLLWFFYPANLTLNFVLFALLGLWMAITAGQTGITGGTKEISLTGHPFKIFALMLSLVVVVIMSILGFWLFAKRYTAHLYYLKGVSAAGENIDEGTNLIARAVNLDSQSLYLRNLAEAYLLRTRKLLEDQTTPQEQKSEAIRQSIQTAIEAGRLAVLKNPANSQNWLQLGLVYENILPLIDGAEGPALENYQKAADLDLKNPQIPFQIGRVHFAMRQKIANILEGLKSSEQPDEARISQAQKLYETHASEAKAALQKSLELKPDYKPALDLLQEVQK